MAEKKDKYYNGKIYVGVTPASFGRSDHWNTESEAEHNAAFEAYINHITSFTSYPVSGPHSWTDGQDVTGLYEFRYQRMHYDAHEWENCSKDNYNKGKYDFRIAALPSPVPPVKDMEAEARGRTFVIQSDIDNLDKIKAIISKLETTDEFHVDWENIGLVETLMRVINNIKNFDNYFKKIESKPGSWFNAECEECGWFGSSEYCLGGHAIADTGDFSEVCCPVCNCEVL